MKQQNQNQEYGGLRWERVKTLVHTRLVSQHAEERQDAAKGLFEYTPKQWNLEHVNGGIDSLHYLSSSPDTVQTSSAGTLKSKSLQVRYSTCTESGYTYKNSLTGEYQRENVGIPGSSLLPDIQEVEGESSIDSSFDADDENGDDDFDDADSDILDTDSLTRDDPIFEQIKQSVSKTLQRADSLTSVYTTTSVGSVAPKLKTAETFTSIPYGFQPKQHMNTGEEC
ncbi:hypothetical protein ScPMuIL_004312 [Solemya velum]